MEQAIEDRGGEDVVAEDGAPLRHDLVGSDQQAAAFVPPGDELKKEMRAAALEWQVAELVDDQQLPCSCDGYVCATSAGTDPQTTVKLTPSAAVQVFA